MSPNQQVKKKSIEKLSENSKLALKSKCKRDKQDKKKNPQSLLHQGKLKVQQILCSNEDDEMLESDLDELLNIYKSKDKFGKMIALSFAAQKYSKTVVMEAFNCSK